MKKPTMWLIIATLGIAGLIFILRKPAPTVGVPAVIGVPGVPAVAPTVPTTCREKAIFLAQQQLGLPESELTVRGLIPQDLGLTTWSFNLAMTGWNTVVSTNIQDNRFCCITGVSYSGTACEQIRVRVGASTVAHFSIEKIPGLISHYEDIQPILAQQNLPVVIEAFASAVAAGDNVILEGITVEKRGMVLA